MVGSASCTVPGSRKTLALRGHISTHDKRKKSQTLQDGRAKATGLLFRVPAWWSILLTFRDLLSRKKGPGAGIGGWRPSRLASACRLSVSCQVAHAPISVIESMFGHANPPSVAAKTGPWHLGNFRSCHLVASSDRLRSVRHRGPMGIRIENVPSRIAPHDALCTSCSPWIRIQ